MNSKSFIVTALLGAAAAHAAPSSLEVEFAKCRALGEASARYACYDAIPLPTPSMAKAPAAATAPAPAPVAGSARAVEMEKFGLIEKSRPDEVLNIQSQVDKDFDGWRPNQRIRLANGQVWQVADDSNGFVGSKHRNVTIRKGAMGAFYLEFDGTSSSLRVRRLQ